MMVYGRSYFMTTSGPRSEISTRDASSQILSLYDSMPYKEWGGSEMDNCCFVNWQLFILSKCVCHILLVRQQMLIDRHISVLYWLDPEEVMVPWKSFVLRWLVIDQGWR